MGPYRGPQWGETRGMSDDAETKIEIARLRLMANRQGLKLSRSGRRDPSAAGYGLFAIINRATGFEGLGHWRTLEQVRVCLERSRDLNCVSTSRAPHGRGRR